MYARATRRLPGMPRCGGLEWNRTLLLVFLAALGVFVLAGVALARRDYYEKLHCRREQISKDEAYIARNCRDPKVKDELGVEIECHLRAHRVEQSPELHAFYDVLEERTTLCSSPEGCVAVLSDRPILFFYLLLVALILLIALGFVYMYQRSVAWSERQRLPFSKKME